jgi:ribosomal protein S27E
VRCGSTVHGTLVFASTSVMTMCFICAAFCVGDVCTEPQND